MAGGVCLYDIMIIILCIGPIKVMAGSMSGSVPDKLSTTRSTSIELLSSAGMGDDMQVTKSYKRDAKHRLVVIMFNFISVDSIC